MGVIGTLKRTFGLAQGDHVYECDDCGEQYHSHMATESLASCPECGSENATKQG
jgi:DNA-directed RNA polymerase subunit RPC12/RpoP